MASARHRPRKGASQVGQPSRVVSGTGGNVVSRATTASAFTDARRPGFAYDAARNRVSHASPNSGTAAFTHTALGELRTQRDALGNTSTWTYDLLGRRTSRSDPDGKAYWTYDPANGKGLLHRRCQGAATLTGCGATPDFAETLTYGADARPASSSTVIRADGQAARTYSRGFGYDSSGRLSTVSQPSGHHVARLQRPRLSRGGARQRDEGGAGNLLGHGRLRQRDRSDAPQRRFDDVDVRRRHRPADGREDHAWNGRRADCGAGLRLLVAQRRPAGEPIDGKRRVQADGDLRPGRPGPAHPRH